MMDPMWYFIERSFQTIAHFILWSFLLSMKYCSLFCSSFLMIFELNVHWRGHLKKCLVFFSRTNNSSCSNTFKCVYISEAGTKPLDTFVSYFLNEHLNNLHWFLHDVEKKEQKRCQFVFFFNSEITLYKQIQWENDGTAFESTSKSCQTKISWEITKTFENAKPITVHKNVQIAE